MFRGLAIRVSGSRGNISFALQAVAQLRITLADMAAQYVAAGGFVLREIANRTGLGL
jgi:hypothetical protein